MRKLMLLVVILIMGIVFAGCQQAGLTEEEVRSIVREEVTKQLGAIDELTLSELNIVNKEGEVVATFYTMLNGAGAINLRNYDGRIIATLLSDSTGNPHFELLNAYEENVIYIAASPMGDGYIGVTDKYGNVTFSAP